MITKDPLFPLLYRLRNVQSELGKLLLKIFSLEKIKIDPAWINVILLIQLKNKVSVKEIANKLALTHPAVVQLINKMDNTGLIISKKSSNDGRKKEIELSTSGIKLGLKLNAILEIVQKNLSRDQLNLEGEFLTVINDFTSRISDKNFFKNISTELKEWQLQKVKLTTYKPELKKYFKSLNYDSLKEYFSIEPVDEKQLSNPESEIIKKGGEIFFALLEDEVVGTCAVLKIDEMNFELSKMAVSKAARGRQAGKKLSLAAIGFAVSNNAKLLTLYINDKLKAALGLFHSLGFEYVNNLDEIPEYKDGPIRMELKLK